jgi:outer membrane receptor for ferrienterochelin and colicins
MGEDREGGTMSGRVLPAGGAFGEALHTRRVDTGAIARFPLGEGLIVNARGSASLTNRDRVFGDTRIQNTQSAVFGETTLQGQLNAHRWVLGAALQYERLHTDDVPGVSFDYTVPALFAQDEFAPTSWVSYALSGRVDAHSDYGTYFSPRVSALFRPGSDWSLRASVGTGFSAPTPLIEEVQSRSLGLLNPLRNLHVERASSMSLDAKWAEKPWDVNISVFSSEIRHPLDVEDSVQPGRLELVNNAGPLKSRGAEMLIGFTVGPVHTLANATYLDVTEIDPLGGSSLKMRSEVASEWRFSTPALRRSRRIRIAPRVAGISRSMRWPSCVWGRSRYSRMRSI